jgi:hypothetical protein
VIGYGDLISMIQAYSCESSNCRSRLELSTPERQPSGTSLRWHVPASPELYEAGWVFKRGRTSSLTYCPVHIGRALRCSCDRFRGQLFDTPTCPQHSATSTVRAGKAAIDARPEAFARLLNLTVMEAS